MILYSKIRGHVLTPFLIRVRIIEKDQSTIGRLLYYANRKVPMGISR